MVISQYIVISIFSSFLWHLSQGLWLFWLPYIVARKSIDPCKQTKRELMDSYTVNVSRRFNKLHNCVSRNGCRINTCTTQPNQMILVSFFSEDNVLSAKIKICFIVSNIKVMQIEHSAFLGTPGIITTNEVQIRKSSFLMNPHSIMIM